MRRFAILVPALVIAGCVTPPPPSYVIERGQRYEIASATTPRRLADCTAANARGFYDRYTSEVHEQVQPDNFQVLVHRHFDPIVVGRATPAPGGAQMVLYVSADLDGRERADWFERLRRGCELQVRAISVEPVRVIVPAEPRPVPPPARSTRG